MFSNNWHGTKTSSWYVCSDVILCLNLHIKSILTEYYKYDCLAAYKQVLNQNHVSIKLSDNSVRPEPHINSYFNKQI